MEARLAVHDQLSSWFAEQTDLELMALLARAEPRPGWGMSQTVEVAGHRVFVKTIPVTDLELANPGSTRNHFDLPIVYSYGVGSAGFGAAREVAAHVTTTEWVRDGVIGGFPLLHHHRLLPLAGRTRKRSGEQLERYVDSWDGDPTIRRFIEARQASTHSIAMFIEHFPHVLQDWLPLNQDAIGWVVDQAIEITTFLRGKGVAHLDSNPSNILTDGKQLFFADFGLFLDHNFDLTDQERGFLEGHRYFDIAEFITSLDWQPPDQAVKHDEAYKRALTPYRALIDEMSAWFSRLAAGPRRVADTTTPELHRCLPRHGGHRRAADRANELGRLSLTTAT